MIDTVGHVIDTMLIKFNVDKINDKKNRNEKNRPKTGIAIEFYGFNAVPFILLTVIFSAVIRVINL